MTYHEEQPDGKLFNRDVAALLLGYIFHFKKLFFTSLALQFEGR